MTTKDTPTTTPRTPPAHTEFLIGWICVLQKEYRAAASILDERYDTTGLVRGQGDRNQYIMGRVGEHNVSINVPPAGSYGQLHASRIALDMKSTFPRMRFVLLVGIAGGVPLLKHHIRLGDVVLGTRVVPYATGKETDGGFERSGLVKAPPMELLGTLTFLDERIWSGDLVLSKSIERIRTKAGRIAADFVRPPEDRLYRNSYIHQDSYCDCLQPGLQQENLCPPDDREAGSVRLFQGGIGSDNIVMKNAASRDEIARREDILCFEMEATGVMDVTPCLSIRGISDYADGHKNDDWHLYAALAAATCARELLLSLPPQAIAQFPMTIAGDQVDRYITGAVSNPNHFSGSDIERLRQTRENLMERHTFLEELVRTELRKMKNEKAKDDLHEVRRRTERFQSFQKDLRVHLEDLSRSVKQRDDLLSSQDPVVREEYKQLDTQVRRDEEAMAQLAQDSLQATGSLLKRWGAVFSSPQLTSAGTTLGNSGEYIRYITWLLGPGLLFPTVATWRWLELRVFNNGPPRLGNAAEVQSMLTFV